MPPHASGMPRSTSGIEKRVPWTASKFHGTPGPPLPYLSERVFPALTFQNPVDLVAVPGTDRLLVVELGGKLWTFSNRPDASKAELAANLKELPDAQAVGDAFRVYGFAFHPDFERNRHCFVCYVLKAGDPNGTRVSRFQAGENSIRGAIFVAASSNAA